MTAQTAGRRVRPILAALSRRSAAGLRLLRKTRTRRSLVRDDARSALEIHLIEPTWHWYLLVAAGSGLGGAGRLFVSTLVGRVAGYGFPWGTIVVNVLGCCAVGALGALFASANPLHLRHDLRMLLIVGILGGFTTFSAFSLETLQLVQRGAVGSAAAYVAASVVLCLLAAAVSYAAVSAMLR